MPLARRVCAMPLMPSSDCFLIRESRRALTLSNLHCELVYVVRSRPLVSTAIRGDRYAVGYSAARPSDP
jgi:hypothetical protein